MILYLTIYNEQWRKKFNPIFSINFKYCRSWGRVPTGSSGRPSTSKPKILLPSKKFLMPFKMQPMPRELFDKLFFFGNSTDTPTSSDYNTSFGHKIIKTSISYSISWRLIFMLSFGPKSFKMFTKNMSCISKFLLNLGFLRD